jgi:hypothetical protein
MQFFTIAWWYGRDGRAHDAFAGYHARLALIRDRLPADLFATEESVSLHDCRLRTLELFADRLTLSLESLNGSEELILNYLGVRSYRSFSDPNTGLPGPFGYGDLGYCEIDLLPDGMIEHRLLFSTGIECVIVFRGFQLQRSNSLASSVSRAANNDS